MGRDRVGFGRSSYALTAPTSLCPPQPKSLEEVALDLQLPGAAVVNNSEPVLEPESATRQRTRSENPPT